MHKYGAEFIGTFWLVLGGCGSAVLAANISGRWHRSTWSFTRVWSDCTDDGLRDWPYSGCHLNPAVSVGLWAGGRFPAQQLLPYIVAQVLGAVAAGGVGNYQITTASHGSLQNAYKSSIAAEVFTTQ